MLAGMSKVTAAVSRSKTRYRLRNWPEYDRGLIARGDLTVWLSPDLVWRAAEGTGKRGHAIERASTLPVSRD